MFLLLAPCGPQLRKHALCIGLAGSQEHNVLDRKPAVASCLYATDVGVIVETAIDRNCVPDFCVTEHIFREKKRKKKASLRDNLQ